MRRDSTTQAELATFLGLTFTVSAIWYWLIFAAGGLAHAGGYVTALMWSPAVDALVTQVIFHRTLRGLGWRWPTLRWAVLAYFLPLAYATVAYGTVWLAGLGSLDLARGPRNALTFVFLGTLVSLATATGEELGWRGYLVPALGRTMSLARVAVVRGFIWAAWHLPLIVFADYNAGTSTWYAVLCFTIGVVALSLPMAWLRLRSGSVWPAALLHASHNLYVQGFFDKVTVDTGATRWFTGEFGAAFAITIGVTAWLFWRVRHAVLVPSGASATGN
ncbi:MAG TPA: type II CAAX endopeptidase family protein [Candidatus Binatia bacterium]